VGERPRPKQHAGFRRQGFPVGGFLIFDMNMKRDGKIRSTTLKRVWLALAWLGMSLGALMAAEKSVDAVVANDAQGGERGGESEFTLGEIPPLSLACQGHVSTTRNGVKFDVFFDNGRKTSAVIYTINTDVVIEPALFRDSHAPFSPKDSK
jgi:hypothetical protein